MTESLVVTNIPKSEKDIETVSQWMWGFWEKQDGYTLSDIIDRTHRCLNTQGIPQTCFAYNNKEIVGVASIWNNDCQCRQELRPWLARVFVKKEERGQGISHKLTDFAALQCEKLNCSEMFLITSYEGLYESLGWAFVENVSYKGEPKRLYNVSLGEGES